MSLTPGYLYKSRNGHVWKALEETFDGGRQRRFLLVYSPPNGLSNPGSFTYGFVDRLGIDFDYAPAKEIAP